MAALTFPASPLSPPHWLFAPCCFASVRLSALSSKPPLPHTLSHTPTVFVAKRQAMSNGLFL